MQQAQQTAGRYLAQVEEVLGEAQTSGPGEAVAAARRLIALTYRFPEATNENLPQLEPLRKALRDCHPRSIDGEAVRRTLVSTALEWPSIRPGYQRDLARLYHKGHWVVEFPIRSVS